VILNTLYYIPKGKELSIYGELEGKNYGN